MKMYDITYDKFLFYGMALTGSIESYYFTKDYAEDFNGKTTLDIQDGDFKKFIGLVSMDSEQFKNYEGSLLNPIQKYPILKTDFIPPGMNEPVNLILSKACLFNKLINGIYFDLLESNMEADGRNNFKTVFGYVFQNYIGIIVKGTFQKVEYYT